MDITNNHIYFKEVQKSDTIIRFVSHGTVLDFTSEKDKTISEKNRKFIVNGLNHLLEWAYIHEKHSFLNKFTLFIVYLKSKLTAPTFTMDIEDSLKRATGKNEIENIKGELYADIFSNIDKEIIYTIMEYVDYKEIYTIDGVEREFKVLTYNSPKANVNNVNEAIPNLEDIDLFGLCVIIVLSKIITLGSILLGMGKLSSFTLKTIMEISSRVADPELASYLYNKNDDRFHMLIRNNTSKSNIFDNIYTYMRDIIVREHLSKNKPTAELIEVNGKSEDAIIKEIIDYSLSTIYKINPIEVEFEESAIPFSMKKDYRLYGFTARNMVGYIKKIIKENHNNKNKRVKHPNVVKNKRVVDDVASMTGSYHKQELILEKRDTKDLNRRKENINVLSNYTKKYLKDNGINPDDYFIQKTPLTDFFMIKLLTEISEDYVTLKIINSKLYTLFTLLISHRLQDKYLYLSFALKSTHMMMRVLFPNDIQKYETLLPQIKTYHLDPGKYKESFFNIIANEYQYTPIGGKTTQLITIDNEFFQFLKDDQENPFVFVEGYLYDYELL